MSPKLVALAQLARLDRPIGTLLFLWPTLWALFLAADGLPPFDVLAVFVLGVYMMRAAGCVINDYADRHFDGHVKRTKDRPLPSGRISEKEALALFFGLVLASFALVLTQNLLTIQLSFVGVALAFVYPFMKRYTHLPQLVLGLAFSWGIPMGFAAVQDTIPPVAWLLFMANNCWIIAYDTLYAMVDRDDDLKIGVKSTAILFGRWDKAAIGGLQLSTLLLLMLVGNWLALSAGFHWSLLAAFALFVYQQYLVRERERMPCFQAFMNNNYVGLVIFLGVLAGVYL
ncbi:MULTISPECIES: 4-hydroxybenzoate octaprenyltransferase [Salinivibrio]|jgi:4-hydroxybenzoate polyprenyltransferase|uniref:4-hydroxybenzoate octaprenyltransferase n=1 Tax=Salinivibrio proteolyticus TaxID=334715 RepID=A0ABY7LG49_9GAMM|nr:MULTISPECIES: 4-hydroxybenzoate octaprenyltransferase [Salinivibrio]OOF11853.1 4-hydroxybenzoate polyprenyltransferase [Salinivibrio sp. PR5]WBA14845.1 4-hydroxybenzoate octaprenyltransferase [Salinivibrio proteolyticus]